MTIITSKSQSITLSSLENMLIISKTMPKIWAVKNVQFLSYSKSSNNREKIPRFKPCEEETLSYVSLCTVILQDGETPTIQAFPGPTWQVHSCFMTNMDFPHNVISDIKGVTLHSPSQICRFNFWTGIMPSQAMFWAEYKSVALEHRWQLFLPEGPTGLFQSEARQPQGKNLVYYFKNT